MSQFFFLFFFFLQHRMTSFIWIYWSFFFKARIRVMGGFLADKFSKRYELQGTGSRNRVGLALYFDSQYESFGLRCCKFLYHDSLINYLPSRRLSENVRMFFFLSFPFMSFCSQEAALQVLKQQEKKRQQKTKPKKKNKAIRCMECFEPFKYNNFYMFLDSFGKKIIVSTPPPTHTHSYFIPTVHRS